jgi:hypothetical protein
LSIVYRHESFTAADRPGASSGCKPFEDYSVDDDDDKNNCGAFSTVSNKELDWELFDKCFKDNFLFKKKKICQQFFFISPGKLKNLLIQTCCSFFFGHDSVFLR